MLITTTMGMLQSKSIVSHENQGILNHTGLRSAEDVETTLPGKQYNISKERDFSTEDTSGPEFFRALRRDWLLPSCNNITIPEIGVISAPMDTISAHILASGKRIHPGVELAEVTEWLQCEWEAEESPSRIRTSLPV